jgi:hypothetical protein
MNYTEAYDLTFKMEQDSTVLYPWKGNVAYYYEKPILSNGLFTNVYFKQSPLLERLKTEYEQRILLPDNNENKGKVSLKCKGIGIDFLYLVFEGFNDKEELLYHNTLFVKPDTVLKQFSKTIPLHNISLLNIKIHAEGVKREDAQISFGKLDIDIGKKSIDSYKLKELPAIESVDLQENRILNDTIFDNRKLLVLGESVHNNQTIIDFFTELALTDIKNNKCKLLLLEMSMESLLKYNKYINEKDFYWDGETDLMYQYRNLMDSIKSYNLNHKKEDRVMLCGFDYNYVLLNDFQNSALEIIDYLISVNKQYNSELIDNLLLKLKKTDWTDAISYLRDNENDLKKILDIGDYECIRHILEVSKNAGSDAIERFIKRDSIMFVNTKFLIDNFAKGDKNIILKSHAIHVNIFSTFPAVPCTPFGVYMKEEYKDLYAPVLVLVAEGNTIVLDKNNLTEYALSSPIDGSIEKYLDLSGQDKIYAPMSENLNRLVYSRFLGSGKIVNEFFPFNLYKRFSGIIFLKGVVSGLDTGKIISSFENRTIKHLQNISNRNQILEEIKKKHGQMP